MACKIYASLSTMKKFSRSKAVTFISKVVVS